MSTTTALLHPASLLEDKVAGVWLRLRLPDGWEPTALSGTPTGRVGQLAWRLLRTGIEGREGWSTEVVVTNEASDDAVFDLVFVEDPALTPDEVLAANRLYPSQYLDLTPVDLGERGTAVAVRQNLPGKTNPWALVGSWTGASGWATDVTQLTGRGLAEGAAWPGLRRDLPSRRLQGEHAAAILQSATVRLGPGESWRGGCFVLLVEDHPEATSQADAALADGLTPSGEPRQIVTQDPASLVGRGAPPVVARDLTSDELERLVPGARHHVERSDGEDVAWFTGGGAHLVTAAKQRAVLRAHGQILRPFGRLTPDAADVTCTVWMDGGFCSHLTHGHAALGRILAAPETPLGIGRIQGLRIAVDVGADWQLLGTPSAWLSDLDSATWFYALGERMVRVDTRGPRPDGAVDVEVATLKGDPVPALVILAFDWHGAPGQLGVVEVSGSEVSVTAPPTALAAATGSWLEIELPDGARVAGDEALFSDGETRGEPVVTVGVEAADQWRLRLRPRTPEAGTPARRGPGWESAREALSVGAEGGSAELVSRIDAMLAWFAHDALVHYLSPRGLEQHTGGAWGTRDVAQGPIGLLRAWGEHDAWRELLLTVFRAQHERGDWPQAFDFLPGFRRDVVADSHGDVVYWPLLALGQYLEATGDRTLLDERVPFTGDGVRGSTGTVTSHVARALDAIEATLVAGTALPAYGHGDWNDSLQPADPQLADAMVSTWTAVLQIEALTRLASGLGSGSSEGERAGALAEATAADLRRHLLVDGVLAGYAVVDDAGDFSPLIHPRDRSTGLTYSVLPMIHAISGDLLTPDEARDHLALIAEHLTGPDGVRLFDRPVAYRGGPMRTFQRAEAASFFGREIGLMYMHAHLRYAEALARHGDGAQLLRALALAVPIGVDELVPSAAPRQSNTYASSSDAAFADRYEAAAHYDRVRAGDVALEGGWRVYSSGPGLFLEVLTQRMLGLRHAGVEVEIDPVIDPALGRLEATLPMLGHPLRIEIETGPLGHGVTAVEADGRPLDTRPLSNPYREPGVGVSAGDLRDVTTLRIVTA